MNYCFIFELEIMCFHTAVWITTVSKTKTEQQVNPCSTRQGGNTNLFLGLKVHRVISHNRAWILHYYSGTSSVLRLQLSDGAAPCSAPKTLRVEGQYTRPSIMLFLQCWLILKLSVCSAICSIANWVNIISAWTKACIRHRLLFWSTFRLHQYIYSYFIFNCGNGIHLH